MIGHSTPRVDGVDKVTGAAKFTGDLSFSHLLEAKVLRSVLPHALIESIDVRKAQAVPGVVAVLTRDDLHDIDPYYGNCLRDRAVVATDRVRFVGEPVAVVAAENGLIAETALALIEVQYKELPSENIWKRVAAGWDFILQGLHLPRRLFHRTGTGIIISFWDPENIRETHGVRHRLY